MMIEAKLDIYWTTLIRFESLLIEPELWDMAATAHRFTVFTAKYKLNTRGRQRGQGKVELDEVGDGPVDVVLDVVSGVQSRTGDGEPPIEIAPELWFAQEEDDESTTEA